MGLDMYLHAQKYFHQVDFAKSTPKEYAISEDFTNLMTMTKLSEVKSEMSGASVQVTCAYWRKANAIHGWFVDNVQDGKDDCKEYYVTKEELQALRELCQRSDNEKNPSLLMPVAGFYFGSDDVDEYYWSQMKDTIVQIDRILALPDIDDLSFYYQSSW
jgi:hypothetical protein